MYSAQPTAARTAPRSPNQPLRWLTLRRLWWVVTWAAILAFLAWAIRVAAIEGYVYPLSHAFQGDFKSAITGEGLPPGEWWAGLGLFYGPIFVLEWKYLLYPGYVSIVDVAHLDLALLAVAFVCTLAAVFKHIHARLFVLLLAAWLANYVTVSLIAAAQHLEVLELALLALALLLLTRGRSGAAGVSLGLAVATKTLPVVFLPYLVILRQWRALIFSTATSGGLLLVTCAVQGVTPWAGAVMLLNQGQNLDKTKATEYELGLRAFFIRYLTNGQGDPTPLQTQIAFGLHAVVAIVAMAACGVVVWRTRKAGRSLAVGWGLIATTMLIVAPVTHVFYYVFLLPAWTALFADLVGRRLTWATGAHWLALVASYVLMGFDAPFLALNRLAPVLARPILDHWLGFIPLVLLLTFAALASDLLVFHSGPRMDAQWSRASAAQRLATG